MANRYHKSLSMWNIELIVKSLDLKANDSNILSVLELSKVDIEMLEVRWL